MQTEVRDKPRLAVVAAVQLPNVTDVEFDASITELRQLAKTLGFSIARTFTQKRPRFDATAYLGVGKRDEMRRFIGNVPDADEDASETPRGVDVDD
ncbi:MAG: GTPase HflX, partial [Casimicrobiaceae bacterium]